MAHPSTASHQSELNDGRQYNEEIKDVPRDAEVAAETVCTELEDGLQKKYDAERLQYHKPRQ